MKILHVNLVYLPAYRYGGPILSVHNLNKWLVKKGADVTVYTTSIDGPNNLDVPLGTPVDIDGVKVYYFPSKFLRKWFYSRDLRRHLAEHINEFDLIHVTAVFTAASALVRYYAKKHKKPFIISPRGSLMKEPILMKKSFLKRLYIALIEHGNLKNADAVHFTTEAEKEEYEKFGFRFAKSMVIPNGLDPSDYDARGPLRSFRKRWEIVDDKKIILFLGRITWKKGLDTLIPALRKVKERYRNCVLAIAGNDDEGYGDVVRGWVAGCGLENDVLFTGILLKDDKLSILKESSLFVLPSYSENFGMAVVEAMYMGLPVVVTSGVAIAPSILNAGAGIVVGKDEESVAAGIADILNGEAKAGEMGANGRRLVEREFLMPAVADKFLEEYKSIISGRS